MAENQLAVVEQPQTQRGIITKEVLQEAAEQRSLLSQYVRQQMREGTDFGVIPGTDKPTLLKPGAEKLVELFRCTPKFKLMEKIEDFDKQLFAYTFRVQLMQRDSEAVLAEGYGSANSREGRYRWRNAGRKCPNCGKETIIKGKEEYGGGWLCFAKKGGCGSKWKAGDKTIESQEQGRVENDDVATLANTILKMAKKRAMVDGAIALARVSDLFTQDVEDLPPDVAPEPPQTPAAERTVTTRATDPADAFRKSIADATTLDALTAVAQAIDAASKSKALTEAKTEELRKLWLERNTALQGKAA